MSAEREQQAAHAFESIVLTLSQTGLPSQDGHIPVRTIRLTATEPKVMIGRSSKTISKGLIPAVDNGYFDSPVVSRTHAQIDADLDEGILRLTDVGSLHGTSVNDKPLDKGIASILQPGDTIRFGIHVARGLDVYYPTACKVGIDSHVALLTVEKARSYRAPESADELSDASECDCSSVRNHSNTESDAADDKSDNMQADALEDDSRSIADSQSSSQASDFGDVTLAQDAEVTVEDRTDYGEGESDRESDYEEDDDAMSIGSEDDDLVSLHSHNFHNDGIDAEEEDLEEENVQNSTHDEADESADSGEDDGGEFLDQELKQFSKDADKSVSASPAPHEVTSPSAEDSLPNHGLRTPPAWPAEDVSTSAGLFEEGCVGDHEAADNNTRSSGRRSVILGDTVPLSVTNKCNISSILNPSPPPSSPTQENARSVSVAAPATYYDSEDFGMYDASVTPHNAPDIWNISGHEATVTAANSPPIIMHTAGLFVPFPDREVMSPVIAEEAAAWAGTTLAATRHLDDFCMPAEAAYIAATSEAVDENKDDDDDDVAMVSAAVFHAHKKEKENKKRKADEMLASTTSPSNLPTTINCEACNEAELRLSSRSQDGPVVKRQATAAAVAAKKKIKGRAWALAETIGIAALGGAVVLGSLIYTAPSF